MIRPTVRWRAFRDEEAAELAAGELSPQDAVWHRCCPDRFLDPVDAALDAYAAAIAVLPSGAESYPAVMERLRTAVEALNAVQAATGLIATAEREELCDWLDAVLIGHGIDIDALAASRGVTRYELTDEWRNW